MMNEQPPLTRAQWENAVDADLTRITAEYVRTPDDLASLRARITARLDASWRQVITPQVRGARLPGRAADPLPADPQTAGTSSYRGPACDMVITDDPIPLWPFTLGEDRATPESPPRGIVTALPDPVPSATSPLEDIVRYLDSRSLLVLGACGHWWKETTSADWKPDPAVPRVCGCCRYDPDRESHVARSPQGMAMVSVTYRPWSDDSRVQEEREHG